MKLILFRFCRALAVTAFLFTIKPAFSQTNVVFDIETNLTSFSVIQSIALPGNKIAVFGWENGSVALKVYSSMGILSSSTIVDSSFSWQHSTLPVALRTFTANLLSNKQVRLNWSTASEINNAGFEIERSTDAVNFTAIGEVKGNGTIDRISEYSFTDTKILNGTVYYRMRQVDIDGHKKDLGVRMVKSGTTNSNLTVFPNPIQGATITIDAGGRSLPLEWEMMDAKGQRLKSGKMEQQQVEIGVADLSKGIYFLRIGKEEVIKIRK